jgi:RNA polymerase sigma factor (TIGR02999 family)
MSEFRQGDQGAAAQLVEHFYPELRRMAGRQMRQERPDHTLQATALVNELYLQLMQVKNLPPAGSDEESERRLFLGLAGFLMKRLLIHHARPLSKKAEKIELAEHLAGATTAAADLLEVEQLLAKLAEMDAVLAQVVQLRVFDGLTREQIAERLGISVRSVARHWEFARRWLCAALAIGEMD